MAAKPQSIRPVGATDHVMEGEIEHRVGPPGRTLVEELAIIETENAKEPEPNPYWEGVASGLRRARNLAAGTIAFPAPLTATEKSAFLGLQAQAREYERAVNEQERAIVSEIEARLGLDAGSIGVSHTVNPQTWTVAVLPILPKGHPHPPQPDAPDA